MKTYESTRGSYSCSCAEALVSGIAPDGGLFLPAEPEDGSFDVRACLEKDWNGAAAMILEHFFPDLEGMEELVRSSYEGRFDPADPVPLVKAGDRYLLELFHGPTYAFKDVALSVLPRLLTTAKRELGDDSLTLILTATSGDTGKAALSGFMDVPGTAIIVFYPADGVSEVQKLQMTTQKGDNVRVVGVKGNFDDCQTGVKEAFAALNASGELKKEGIGLSSANSINIGRLVPQITYYFTAYAALMRNGALNWPEKADFAVPTGNFGDILAGYLAKRMGLPVGKLICSSNRNDVLTEFFRTGTYDRRRELRLTSSPSMDILVSSNLERLLYLATGRDGGAVRDMMRRLSEDGIYTVSGELLERLKEDFSAYSCGEEQTMETIRRFHERTGYVADPHTAVGLYCADMYEKEEGSGRPVVVLSTASPFKFASSVLAAVRGEKAAGGPGDIKELEKVSGLEAPEGIRELEKAEIRFRTVCGPDGIRNEVTEFAKRERRCP